MSVPNIRIEILLDFSNNCVYEELMTMMNCGTMFKKVLNTFGRLMIIIVGNECSQYSHRKQQKGRDLTIAQR